MIPLDVVGDISSKANSWKIKARIISLWKIPTHIIPLSHSALEILLIDKEGHKIEASVSKLRPISGEIVDGLAYKISNFDIVRNTASQPYTRNGYIIVLHSDSQIVEIVDDRIPRNGWSFLRMNHIVAVADNFGSLVDVMGILIATSREKLLIKSRRAYKMMFIHLLDNTDKCGCVLIGEIVGILSEYLSVHWNQRPIVSLRFVDVRRIQGKLVIQTVPYVSKIYVNHIFEQESVIGNRFNGLKTDIPVEYLSHPQQTIDMKIEMLEMHPRKTISELLSISPKEGDICVVHGWIISFAKDSTWSYASCICHGEAILENDWFRCKLCQRLTSKTVPRYCLKAEVFDGLNNTTFVLHE